jgi:hypothetical protein
MITLTIIPESEARAIFDPYNHEIAIKVRTNDPEGKIRDGRRPHDFHGNPFVCMDETIAVTVTEQTDDHGRYVQYVAIMPQGFTNQPAKRITP